jgi:hypothetical protein
LLLCLCILSLSSCERAPKVPSREVIFPEHPSNTELLAQAKSGSKEARKILHARIDTQRKAIEDARIVISDTDLQSDVTTTINEEFSGNRNEFISVLSEQGYTLERYMQVRRQVLAMNELKRLIGEKERSK